MSVTISPNGREGELIIPNIGYEAICRTGYPGLWNISLLFEQCTIQVRRHKEFMDNLFNDNTYIFPVVVIEMNNLSALFKNIKDKGIAIGLKLSKRLVSFGKSSLVMEIQIVDKDTEEEYGVNKFKYVYVDKSARKAASLPEDLRVKYADLSNKVNMPPFQVNNKPKNAFERKFVIAPSDADFNLHCNQSVYLRFAIDTATFACIAKKLKYFQNDMCNYIVDCAKMCFVKETRVGDEVTCYIWETEESALIEFQVCKEDALCCYGVIKCVDQFQPSL